LDLQERRKSMTSVVVIKKGYAETIYDDGETFVIDMDSHMDAPEEDIAIDMVLLDIVNKWKELSAPNGPLHGCTLGNVHHMVGWIMDSDLVDAEDYIDFPENFVEDVLIMEGFVPRPEPKGENMEPYNPNNWTAEQRRQAIVDDARLEVSLVRARQRLRAACSDNE
jgi:hypothetical protein